MNQKLPTAKQSSTQLPANRFVRNKAHLSLKCCDQDRPDIGCVVILVCDERLDALRRNQSHPMPKRLHAPRPIMCAATGLENDPARSRLGHEFRELLSRELLTVPYFPCSQGSLKPENILGRINSDHHVVLRAVLSAVWL